MEPRSAERGNARCSGGTRIPKVRFNGATLSRTWKPDACNQALKVAQELQWSHAQPNVETIFVAAPHERLTQASMEPRSAERGNPALRRSLTSRIRFNGATLSRTWKHFRKSNCHK